jgi:hypothetical protein
MERVEWIRGELGQVLWLPSLSLIHFVSVLLFTSCFFRPQAFGLAVRRHWMCGRAEMWVGEQSGIVVTLSLLHSYVFGSPFRCAGQIRKHFSSC